MIEQYDIVVLGGGKAGKTLAMDRAKAGQNVCLIEIGMIGGACINIACIPTKTLVRSAGVVDLVRHAASFGAVTEGVSVNMPRIAARTAEVVHGMVDYHLKLFAASGLHLLLGTGRFVEKRVIEVTAHDGSVRRVTAPRIYVNLGTNAAIPAVPGLAEAAPLTHVEALKLEYRAGAAAGAGRRLYRDGTGAGVSSIGQHRGDHRARRAAGGARGR